MNGASDIFPPSSPIFILSFFQLIDKETPWHIADAKKTVDRVPLSAFGKIDPKTKLPEKLLNAGDQMVQQLNRVGWESVLFDVAEKKGFGNMTDIPDLLLKHTWNAPEILRIFHWFMHGANSDYFSKTNQEDSLFYRILYYSEEHIERLGNMMLSY